MNVLCQLEARRDSSCDSSFDPRNVFKSFSYWWPCSVASADLMSFEKTAFLPANLELLSPLDCTSIAMLAGLQKEITPRKQVMNENEYFKHNVYGIAVD